MEYRPIFYFNDDDIDEICEGFLQYHKMSITKEEALKIIKSNLKIFGTSFLLDKQIEEMNPKDYGLNI